MLTAASVIEIAALIILFTVGGVLAFAVLYGFVVEGLLPLLRWILLDPFNPRDDSGIRFWHGIIGLVVMVIGLLLSSDIVTVIGMALFLLMVGLSVKFGLDRRHLGG